MRLAAVLGAARQPFKSTTWHAALTVALARAEDGDLGRVTRLGRRRFGAAVLHQVARWDAVHPWQKIIDAVFTACADPAGVTALLHGDGGPAAGGAHLGHDRTVPTLRAAANPPPPAGGGCETCDSNSA